MQSPHSFPLFYLWVALLFSSNLSFAVIQTKSVFHDVFSNRKLAKEMEGGPFSVHELMKQVLISSQKGDPFYVDILVYAAKPHHRLFQDQISIVIPFIIKNHPLQASTLGEFLNSPIPLLAQVTERALVELCYVSPERKPLERNQARDLRAGQVAAAKALYESNSSGCTELPRRVFTRVFETAEDLSEQINLINALINFKGRLPITLGYEFLSKLLDVHPQIREEILESTQLSHSGKIQKLFSHARVDTMKIYRILRDSGVIGLTNILGGRFQLDLSNEIIRDENETLENRAEAFIDFLTTIRVSRYQWGWEELSDSPFKTFAKKVLIMLSSAESFQNRIEAVKYLNTLGVQYDRITGLLSQKRDETERSHRDETPVLPFNDADVLVDAAFGFFKTPDVDEPKETKVKRHWFYRTSSLSQLEASIEERELFKQFIDLIYLHKDSIIPDLVTPVEQLHKLFHPDRYKQDSRVVFFMNYLLSPTRAHQIQQGILVGVGHPK